MAKRRMTAKQRKYFGKKRRRAAKPRKRARVAKRRKSRVKRKTARRSASVSRRRGRRRGGGGGSFSALKPTGDDMKMWAASAAVGWVETKAKADASFILNKVPKPIDQLGYTGNLALMLWLGSYFVKNKFIRLGARAAANITAYHIGRMGKTFSSGAEFFTVSGWSDDEVAAMLEQSQVGALNATGEAMPGAMSYDEADMAY